MNIDWPTIGLIGGIVSATIAVLRFWIDVGCPLAKRFIAWYGHLLRRGALRLGLGSAGLFGVWLAVPAYLTTLGIAMGKGAAPLGIAMGKGAATLGIMLVVRGIALVACGVLGAISAIGSGATKCSKSRLIRRLTSILPIEFQNEFAEEMDAFEEDAKRDGRWQEPKESGWLLLFVVKTRLIRIRLQLRRAGVRRVSIEMEAVEIQPNPPVVVTPGAVSMTITVSPPAIGIERAEPESQS